MSGPGSSSHQLPQATLHSDASVWQLLSQSMQRYLSEQSTYMHQLQTLAWDNFRTMSAQIVKLEEKVEQQAATIETTARLLNETRQALQKDAKNRVKSAAQQVKECEQQLAEMEEIRANMRLLDSLELAAADLPAPTNASQHLRATSSTSARSTAASRNIAATRPTGRQTPSASSRGRRARSSASATARSERPSVGGAAATTAQASQQ